MKSRLFSGTLIFSCLDMPNIHTHTLSPTFVYPIPVALNVVPPPPSRSGKVLLILQGQTPK